MTYTETILNKIAYADGEKTVTERGLSLVDDGKKYEFRLGPVVYAVGAQKDENPVLGVTDRILGFNAKEEYKNKLI